MTETITATNSYLRDFTGTDTGSDAPGPAWLRSLRQSAAARFADVGFPTRRDEEWRFTNVSPIAETPFTLAAKPQSELTPDGLRPFTYDGMGGTQLVFVNGHFHADLSSQSFPQGVVVSSLAAAMEAAPGLVEAHLGRYAQFTTQAFVALNTAALEDGAFVHIKRGAVWTSRSTCCSSPRRSAGPTVSHPRTLIIAEENCQATIVESYSGTADQVYFTNAVTEVVAAENAVIDHYKVQRESAESLSYRHDAASAWPGARTFPVHSIGLGRPARPQRCQCLSWRRGHRMYPERRVSRQ